MASGETVTLTGERADLTETLQGHRGFLRQTARGLTDEQAAQRTTVSELCIGGLIKHVAATERPQVWREFWRGTAHPVRVLSAATAVRQPLPPRRLRVSWPVSAAVIFPAGCR
jgi:hypothetical protein